MSIFVTLDQGYKVQAISILKSLKVKFQSTYISTLEYIFCLWPHSSSTYTECKFIATFSIRGIKEGYTGIIVYEDK